MTKITIINAEGKETSVDAQDGYSLMHVAVANDIDGIIGECGGAMACGTCHCYVDPQWLDRVGERSDGESDMLDCAASEVRTESRLACQITVVAEFDGLIIRLPKNQA